jgi:enoyl-CoA hydratase/carnithine racemase
MTVLLSAINGSSLVLEMNRPESMNAMSSELAKSLLSAVLAAEENKKIRAIIITGAGDRAFCAGTDLKERRDLSPDKKWEQSRSLFHLNEAIRNSSLPVIAAINGWCLGGGFELALYCDLRIATPESKFGWPEMTLGAYPGGGGAVMLPRIIGQAKAKELFFTARRIDAGDALNLGIINVIVPKEKLMDKAKEFVNNIETTAPLGLAAIKKSINDGADVPFDEAIRVDQNLRRPLESTEDYSEGLLAHFEKRRAIFKGR